MVQTGDTGAGDVLLFGPYLPNYPWTLYSRLRASIEIERSRNWDVTGSLARSVTSDSAPDLPERPQTPADTDETG